MAAAMTRKVKKRKKNLKRRKRMSKRKETVLLKFKKKVRKSHIAKRLSRVRMDALVQGCPVFPLPPLVLSR